MIPESTLEQDGNIITPSSAKLTSHTAATVSFASAALFLILLVVLHLIKPEFDPSWRFISEYAIGSYGWMMVLAFFSLALSYISLFIAIRSQVTGTIAGRIGLILMLISAAGLIIAGIFTTDPITAKADEHTTSGSLHNIGGMLGMAMPFASLFTSWALIRNKSWTSAKRPILWATILTLVAFLFALVSIGAMLSQSGGQFGPQTQVGWSNRFEVLTYCIWLMIVASRAKRLTN
ncbi:MAG: DUF998 domain-containing protein [Chitinophagaceae bacterium]|nr:DUF998 domain-containing protein [Chitinophagaceae bacterium]